MDAIRIREFTLECFIGVSDIERSVKQKIFVELILRADLSLAGISDDLRDTVDYAALLDRLRTEAGSLKYNLLETLARKIASICLDDKRVESVDVTVEKRGVLPALVAVEIHRFGDSQRVERGNA